jgi:hypothetical protein
VYKYIFCFLQLYYYLVRIPILLLAIRTYHTGTVPVRVLHSSYTAVTVGSASRDLKKINCDSKRQVRNSAKNEKALNLIASGLSRNNKRTILRGKDTGGWLSVLPSTVNGTELSAQEFRDSVLLRYARSPPDLPSQCDGCNAALSIRHALLARVQKRQARYPFATMEHTRRVGRSFASKAFFPFRSS